eukprot:COSAG05_NODE_910_length_6641_cov_27.153776_3_plen_49_part_00
MHGSKWPIISARIVAVPIYFCTTRITTDSRSTDIEHSLLDLAVYVLVA